MRKLKLDELNRETVESYQNLPKPQVTLILDNVRSGHNVGSVFRTCDAFAFEEIVLCGITPRPPHKEINKTAIGATMSVSWRYEKEVSQAVRVLKRRNYTIYGIEQTTDSISLQDVIFPEGAPIAIILGNEVNGISEEVLPLLDQAIEIDQYGTKHSFNVSVCAGIISWEVNRAVRKI